MKPLLLLSLLCLWVLTTRAQIVVESASPAYLTTKIPGYSSVTSFNTKTFSYTRSTPVENPTPVDGDTTTEGNGVYEFADLIPVTIAKADGNITNTTPGIVWTLRITVPNALSIGINFSQFALSDSAKMYIFNQSRTVLQGVITKKLFPGATSLNIPSISSNDIIIYVVESGNHGAMQSNLAINKLALGYSTIGEVGGGAATLALSEGVSIFGATINCIPSVVCYPDKMETARAVARISIPRGNKIAQCSGTLLNSEQNNGRPLFLTAYHCIDANDNNNLDANEISALSDASFRFQFWRNGCTGSSNANGRTFIGSVLRAQRRESDMVLLELTNPPGVGDGVTYAGWNRNSGSPPNDKSFIIHHPSGEDMRYTPTRNVRTYLFNSNYWQAFYSNGVVAPGSSGSALFNGENQVVGQLKGGWSSCTWTDFSDRYGKLERSYGNMQSFLSPSQNLSSMNALPLFGLAIKGNSALGCTGTYSVPNLAGCTFAWTASSNVVINSGQSTNAITITKTTPGAGWIRVVINDSKGTQDGRTLTLQKDLTILDNLITGTIRQNGYSPKTLYTENDINLEYADVDFYYPGATSITFKLIAGTAGFSSTPAGDRTILNLYLSTGNYVGFDVTATSPCGTVLNQFYFYGVGPNATGAGLFTVGPNPVKTTLTVTAKNENSMMKSHMIGGNDAAFTAKLYEFNTSNLVRESKSEKGSNTAVLNVQGLTPGQYILRIEHGKYKESRHILIE